MRKGHMNNEAPLGILGETHSVGKRELFSPYLGYGFATHLWRSPDGTSTKISRFAVTHRWTSCKSVPTRSSRASATANV